VGEGTCGNASGDLKTERLLDCSYILAHAGTDHRSTRKCAQPFRQQSKYPEMRSNGCPLPPMPCMRWGKTAHSMSLNLEVFRMKHSFLLWRSLICFDWLDRELSRIEFDRSINQCARQAVCLEEGPREAGVHVKLSFLIIYQVIRGYLCLSRPCIHRHHGPPPRPAANAIYQALVAPPSIHSGLKSG
jgi:hypothetical protein